MFSRLTNKLSGMIIGAVAVLAIVSAGAAMAAQNHVGPFTNSPNSASGEATQTESSFEAQGVIQQVTFDPATTQSGSLVLLLSGKQSTATIFFNAQTEIGEDQSGDQQGQGTDDQQVSLQVGQSVKIEGTLQSDGSVLASEIKITGAIAGTPTQVPEPGEDEKLTGVIQSIDTTGQTFVLAQDNGGGTVTIAFDAGTNIEHEDGGATFAVGAHVRVEVLARADGSLYAKEIKPASDDGQGDGDNGSGNSGSGGGSDNGSHH